ncbi:MAG: PqqD family protein [Bacteroidales bacterium]|nr:PqqD family protein [Bacteroidales bacterium]
MINFDTVYSRSSRIVERETDDECVLVPVTDNIADMKSVYTLNSTGSFIWKLIDGTRTVKDIADEVEKEFEVEGKEALEDVLSFFSDMKEYLIIVE